MSNIILLYPRTGNDIKPTIAPPHSLLTIAALPSKAGYSVKIIDQRVCTNWKAELIKELWSHPLLVGISTMTGTQIHNAINMARIVRRHSKVPIVWGGKHPTLMPKQILDSEYADIICVGEGDYTLKEIADCLAAKRTLSSIKGIMLKGNTEVIEKPQISMEELPEPAWHLINMENYIHQDMYIEGNRVMDIGQTSKGCPFHCLFCSQGRTKWSAISAEKSIERVKRLVKEYRLDGIWFRDDEFYVNQKRVAKICEGILPLGIKWYTSGTRIDLFNKTTDEQVGLYKRSGADVLKFGAESGNNRVLEMIGKGITIEDTLKANIKCRKFGIVPAYNFMAGFPGETLNEIEQTVDFIQRLRRDNSSALFETISLYAPMPGTPMWNTSLEYGLKPPETLEGWINWRFDEHDDSGNRIPWFNAKERKIIGNLCYLNLLVNVIPGLANSYNGSSQGKLFKIAYSLPYKYFNFRLKHKMYRNMPEVKLIRWARKKIFIQNDETIKEGRNK